MQLIHSPSAPEVHSSQCPLCNGRRQRYAFYRAERRYVECMDCNLIFINPGVTDFSGSGTNEPSGVMRQKAAHFLSQLLRYRGKHGGKMLVVCEDGSPFPSVATEDGYDVKSVSPSTVRRLEGEDEFDVCIFWHSLGRSGQPLELLKAAHVVLSAGAVVGIITPDMNSNAAKVLCEDWPAFKTLQSTVFNRPALETSLFFSDFANVVVCKSDRVASIEQLANYTAGRRGWRPALIRFAEKVLPRPLRDLRRSFEGSDMIAFARAVPTRERRKLSIVLPAFNEAATFVDTFEAVLAKEIPGLDIEIVLIESNSTDGTRELAQRYKDHPRVKLILEDRPRGKGFAVRTGLAAATGDFVLIQDADREYDLEDYDTLLEPLIAGRQALVLGSRHSGSVWKMRQFSGQAGLSGVLNFGHWFFTTLVNVLFGLKLKDPFTMYKVFRRDCLHGLRFECNRFDFDYELLIRMVQKGYSPIEIPVNYRSRSFKQGKKVTMFGDPISWLKICFKLRFSDVNSMEQIEKARQETVLPVNAVPSSVQA
jgi:hypothetical protein